MFDLDRAQAQALELLKQIPADEAELHVGARDVASTRFSGNAITQNMDEQSLTLRLRVVKNGRTGIATTNSFDGPVLDAAIARALSAAEHSSPDASLLPMIAEQPKYASVESFDAETANCPAALRADRIGKGVELCKQQGFEAAGLFSTGAKSLLYANSKGVVAAHRASNASLTFSAFADGGNVEGNGQALNRSIARLDTDAICARAIEKCAQGRNPKPIGPGRYDVVLEPAALSDLILFLTWLGFSTQAFIEGRSGLIGKFGEQTFSPKLSMRADPFDARQSGCPFDQEGFATSPLNLIWKGIPKDLPHDRRTAAKLEATNSGYGNEQPDPSGPMPRDIVIGTGDASIEEMIASTEKGLLVSQFHYTNAVDPMALSVTGMTRAGLFQIENGKVSHALTNLRFTESLLRAFKNIEAVESKATSCAGGLFGGGMVLPAMKIKDFTFSSGTGF